ncbi:hypothetical protein GHK92_18765 [Nocardioides sp. dk4132]|uniref:hypothetical protein n=1 Tax=unclassified Nocardioides TaxID=2615069 RepID=UPI001297F51F|nr:MULTISPECIES: hypothetical protein [unclassified Nocardioides]MQW77917.1 hypothetical protein [Nocardioides sp. dk4132]QGA09157.1 hypothetical protein GFH29_18480 [Nocardioides sp. dk884]
MSLTDTGFEVVARHRPVTLVQGDLPAGAAAAPYVAVEAPLVAGQPLAVRLTGRDVVVEASHDPGPGRHGRVRLTARVRDRTVRRAPRELAGALRHRHRALARPDAPVQTLGLALTGTHVTALTRGPGGWTARARLDLAGHLDTRDEDWLSTLGAASSTGAHRWGRFGQLGLRDLRLATHADGTTYHLDDGRLLLTATSAGPGFFDTAHTSVWALDPVTLGLAHRGDLFFRRPDAPGVFGDHACHLVRDGAGWLLATSTWGDFDTSRPMRITLAESGADLTRGQHVLDTRPLEVPTTGVPAVGVWDPHLVRDGDRWLVGYVVATRYFRFGPALATGPALDALTLRSVDTASRECEGTTLLRDPGAGDAWRLLASSKDRQAYPVCDLDLTRLGDLAAPYPSNIPWPTLARTGDGWLLAGFDGTEHGGRLTGYGTHGDVVLMRSVPR